MVFVIFIYEISSGNYCRALELRVEHCALFLNVVKYCANYATEHVCVPSAGYGSLAVAELPYAKHAEG